VAPVYSKTRSSAVSDSRRANYWCISPRRRRDVARFGSFGLVWPSDGREAAPPPRAVRRRDIYGGALAPAARSTQARPVSHRGSRTFESRIRSPAAVPRTPHVDDGPASPHPKFHPPPDSRGGSSASRSRGCAPCLLESSASHAAPIGSAVNGVARARAGATRVPRGCVSALHGLGRPRGTARR